MSSTFKFFDTGSNFGISCSQLGNLMLLGFDLMFEGFDQTLLGFVMTLEGFDQTLVGVDRPPQNGNKFILFFQRRLGSVC